MTRPADSEITPSPAEAPAAATPDAATPDDSTPGFDTLGLDARLVEVLAELGYEEPTAIQSETIPHLLTGRDLIGQAATGTGKTAAFALPLLHRMAQDAGTGPRAQPSALVLVPTRELAMQVAEAVHRYGRGLGTKVLPIYGGQSYSQQLRALKRGIDVVVATPGRALDHLRRGTLSLEGVATVVLDEADEMLDMGFAEDLEAILAETPAERQTVLFSATLPSRIASLARRHLRDPVRIEIAREPVPAGEAPLVRQTAYIVARAHKPAALGRVLDLESPEAAIVFCRTRNEVDEVSRMLAAHGYRVEAIHGGLTQEQRDRVMHKLRTGVAELLVATDVAARGLDIPQLTHVINYDVPSAPESYVHRIGRVGRAGREGVAVTLAEPREHRQLRNIEHLTRRKIAIGQVPTVADLRARRLDLVRASLREALLAGELDSYRVVVESLAEEFDVMEIAMAAVKLAQEASGPEAEPVDIPPVATARERPGRDSRSGSGRPSGPRARGPA
ncbi:MAG TPA: DEAD/DEAH box helicase, partial [Thermoanaerobaculia bacterium]|nr:DEAD/DEAH box helicase [Thermoanaerobaculia bacterium]